MKRFVGLGAALMMGVVLGKEQTYDFQNDKTVQNKNTSRAREAVNVNLEAHRERSASHHTKTRRERSSSRDGLKNRKTIGRKINNIKKVRDLTPSRDGDVFTDKNSRSRHSRDVNSVNKVQPFDWNDYVNNREIPSKAKHQNDNDVRANLDGQEIPGNGYIVQYWYDANGNLMAQDNLGRIMIKTCETDGCEWEWYNFFEPDGTADQSNLTSIDTDYQMATSASVDVKEREITVSPKKRAHRSTSVRHDYDDLYIKKQMKKQTNEISKLKHLTKDKLRDFDDYHRQADYDDYKELNHILKIKEKAHSNFKQWVKNYEKPKENVHIHSHQ